MNLPNDIAELQNLVRECLDRIAILELENKELASENKELRHRLGLNSKNSHKPPSSDIGKKTKSKTKSPGIPKESKSKGGQEGHVGKTLEMSVTPDEIIVHSPVSCTCCGRNFLPSEIQETGKRRQVFDIPMPKMEVQEHRLGMVTCCGKTQEGSFPSTVKAPVQYGNRILSFASVLSVDYRMPYAKISQLFEDLYDCPINESTLIQANATLYENLAPVEDSIKTHLLESEVVHFDETGMRIEAENKWIHTASSPLFCYLFVDSKRGKEALNSSVSILKDFTNYAVHDCWATYFFFENCRHALCNAHLLRELTALKEEGSFWATDMHQFLLKAYHDTKKSTQLIENPTLLITQYQEILGKADLEEPQPIIKKGKTKNTKGRNLYNRFVKHQDKVLAFAFEKNVPFTNNLAEQDIRCVKIKQKIAMSFRTLSGAKVFTRIQGVFKTFRKQGLNIFQHTINANSQEIISFST